LIASAGRRSNPSMRSPGRVSVAHSPSAQLVDVLQELGARWRSGLPPTDRGRRDRAPFQAACLPTSTAKKLMEREAILIQAARPASGRQQARPARRWRPCSLRLPGVCQSSARPGFRAERNIRAAARSEARSTPSARGSRWRWALFGQAPTAGPCRPPFQSFVQDLLQLSPPASAAAVWRRPGLRSAASWARSWRRAVVSGAPRAPRSGPVSCRICPCHGGVAALGLAGPSAGCACPAASAPPGP
jgi:hypothetical protein